MNDWTLAARRLTRAPFFTSLVALMLALGIGANLTIFQLANGFLLKPMPSIKTPETVPGSLLDSRAVRIPPRPVDRASTRMRLAQ